MRARAIIEDSQGHTLRCKGTLMTDIRKRGYAHPETLVSTEWVAEHLNDPNVRIIESNEDTLLYPSGHIPGAVQVDWTADLNDQVRREYITARASTR